MKYISVSETAKKWGVSERSVRGYCAAGKITGVFLTGKTWNIPETAEKPDRINKKTDTPKTLLEVLKAEKAAKLHGGIYHKIQIDLTYNSNHIEGSRLTHDQTRYIFETNTIGVSDGTVKVDDVVETANHFKCIDMIIDSANYALSEAFIKQLHAVLKSGTSDSRLDWFVVGDYKRLPNEVGGMATTAPENVGTEIKKLLAEDKSIANKTFDDLLDFHYRFERIHPFRLPGQQFLEIGGKPVVVYALEVFEHSPEIDQIILVTGADKIEYCQKEIIEKYGIKKRIIHAHNSGNENK